MKAPPAGVLLIGFGNPGRLDDGLGPAAAAALERLGIPGVTVDADYQLSVEDAEAASRFALVLFVDADVAAGEPFGVQAVEPERGASFSSHSVRPAAVIGLSRELFGGRAAAFVIGIRGYEFDGFGERLSTAARQNLDAAVRFLEALLRRGDVDAMIAELNNRARGSTHGDQRCATGNT